MSDKIRFEDFFFNDELNDLKEKIIKNNNFCNKEVFNSCYKCLDCTLLNNSILCVECFENSEHKNHNVIYYSEENLAGICDCGDKEILDPVYYCKFHDGKNEIIDNFSEESKNEIIKIWKYKLFLIIIEFNNLLKNKESIYDISEILNIFDKFTELNKKNIVIIKLLSLSLTSNIENNNNELKNIKEGFLFNLNKEIIEINCKWINSNDLNLNDILLTLNYEEKIQMDSIKNLFYSLFGSINFKINLSKSYIKSFYKISKISYNNDSKFKFGLNFHLFTNKNNNIYLFKSEYFKNYFYSIYFWNKKNIEKYLYFNKIELINFFITIENSECYWFEIRENVNIFILMIIDVFIGNFKMIFDKTSIKVFNFENYINYFFKYIYFLETCLKNINKNKNTDLVNKIYKNFINSLVDYFFNYLNTEYKKEINNIDFIDMNDQLYLIIENIFSMLFSYFVMYNNLLEYSQDNFKNAILDLFSSISNDKLYKMLKIFLYNIVKYYKNIIKLEIFYKSNYYDINELTYYLNEYYLKKFNVFLLQIIKLIISEDEFIEFFLYYYLDLNTKENKFLTKFFIETDYYLITHYTGLILNKGIEYNKGLNLNDKKNEFEKKYNNLEEDSKTDFIWKKNKYLSKLFFIFYELLYKVVNYPLIIQINSIIINKKNKYFNYLALNYFKLVKSKNYKDFLQDTKELTKFAYINSYNDNYENIISSIISENLKFNKDSSKVFLENSDNIIDQNIFFLNYSVFIKKLKELDSIDNYNIFNINNNEFNLKFLNKQSFITKLNNILYNNIFKEYLKEFDLVHQDLIETWDTYIIFILFLLNEEKDKYFELIKNLEKFTKEYHIFNMILNKKQIENQENKNIIKLRHNRLHILLNKIKMTNINKFLVNKNKIIEKSENDICIYCKKEILNNKIIPIQIINENKKYFISSCFHYFHYECDTNIENYINKNCIYCKKYYYILLIYDDDWFSDDIYNHNLKLISYFLEYHNNFSSLAEELIKILLFSDCKNKIIIELLISNILLTINKDFGGLKVKEIFDEMVKNSYNNEILKIKEFENLINYWENDCYHQSEGYIRLFDLIISLLKKSNQYDEVENKDCIKNYIFEICSRRGEYDKLIVDLNLSLNQKKLLNFNESLINNNINIITPLIKVNFEILIDSLGFDDNFNDFQKKCINLKCEYCGSFVFTKKIVFCLLCKKYFCSSEFCEKIIENNGFLQKLITNDTLFKNNLILHNSYYHSNYGIYYNLNKNNAFIFFNRGMYNNTGLYLNGVNKLAYWNSGIVCNSYRFNKNNLKNIFEDYYNKKIN